MKTTEQYAELYNEAAVNEEELTYEELKRLLYDAELRGNEYLLKYQAADEQLQQVEAELANLNGHLSNMLRIFPNELIGYILGIAASSPENIKIFNQVMNEGPSTN